MHKKIDSVGKPYLASSLKRQAKHSDTRRTVIPAPFLCAIWALGFSSHGLTATYIVTNTLDTAGVNVANCSSGVGPCSLRQALETANSTIGVFDTINFAITPLGGVKTILPATSLPPITDSVFIDGYTQSGALPATATAPATLLIELSGAMGPMNINGLTLDGVNSSGSTIRGLVINQFKGPNNNTGNGIFIFNRSANNSITGNHIGTNPAGTMALGNERHGIAEPEAVLLTPSGGNNNFGGGSPAERNVLSGNGFFGIRADALLPNRIKGNYIGTDASGTLDLGNARSGIQTTTAAHTIGCGPFPAVCTAGEGNLISGNEENGITTFFEGNVTIKGNKFGTDVTGTIDLGNTLDGIQFQSGNHTVGCNASPATCTPAEGNLISGNNRLGILISTSSDFNTIAGNKIGTNAAGNAPLGNLETGIFIQNEAKGNVIGNVDPGRGNIIAYNGSDGIVVLESLTTGNLILSNAIFKNALLGIDLGGDGVTLNDNLDPDLGPNNFQNFPILNPQSSFISANIERICGSLDSKVNHTYLIQLFSNAECDTSGYGEGQQFAGQLNVTTDANGHADFCFVTNFQSVLPPVGRIITATATDSIPSADFPSGDGTSEFSPCIEVTQQQCPNGGSSFDNSMGMTLPNEIRPTITKNFRPSEIDDCGCSKMEIKLTNPYCTTSLTTPLIDTLPRGLIMCGKAITTCENPSIFQDFEDSRLIVRRATIPGNSSCTIEVDVRAEFDGDFVNRIPSGALQTTNGSNILPASATLSNCCDESIESDVPPAELEEGRKNMSLE